VLGWGPGANAYVFNAGNLASLVAPVASAQYLSDDWGHCTNFQCQQYLLPKRSNLYGFTGDGGSVVSLTQSLLASKVPLAIANDLQHMNENINWGVTTAKRRIGFTGTDAGTGSVQIYGSDTSGVEVLTASFNLCLVFCVTGKVSSCKLVKKWMIGFHPKLDNLICRDYLGSSPFPANSRISDLFGVNGLHKSCWGLIITFFLLLAGYFIKLSNIPILTKNVFLMCQKYALQGFFRNEFTGLTFTCSRSQINPITGNINFALYFCLCFRLFTKWGNSAATNVNE
jgi:hypothetical protein